MLEKNPLYFYSGTITRVLDGDTFDMSIDIGFNINTKDRIRLFGVNAPELKTPEGIKAKQFLEELIAQKGPEIVFYSIKDKRETFGRYLALVYFGNKNSFDLTLSVNKMILNAGHGSAKYISASDLKEL